MVFKNGCCKLITKCENTHSSLWSVLVLFVVRYVDHKRQKEVCSQHQWVNEAQWEDETVVSSSARRVHSLILRHGYCVPVKHRLRQLNTGMSAGNTGIALRDACPVQEGGFSSLRKTAKCSQWDSKVYYMCFTNHALNNFSLCILPRNILQILSLHNLIPFTTL